MSCVHNLAICVKSEWVNRRRARGSSCLSENAFTAETQSHFFFFFYRLWGSSLSSLTLISAALVRRWSDEASAWMNNAGTPANKRRHPLTPFHGASPYARVPRAFKLPPSAPVWKKKEKREREKQMTAESNINKPEAARKSKRRMRGGGGGWEEKVKRKNAASVFHPTAAALCW